jgi:hypothetical protein
MRISFCAQTDPAPWLAALQQHLPQAQVDVWHSGAARADYAIVWAAPQQFFDEQTALQAVFNMGAGVDALLQRQMRADLPIVRLNDAGMGVQMAEYVCHALIRHTRDFALFETQAQQGLWQEPPVLDRADFPVGILGLGVLGVGAPGPAGIPGGSASPGRRTYAGADRVGAGPTWLARRDGAVAGRMAALHGLIRRWRRGEPLIRA